MRRLILEASLIPIELTIKAWGRRWIDDDQCRVIVTTIMGAALWLVRRQQGEQEADRG